MVSMPRSFARTWRTARPCSCWMAWTKCRWASRPPRQVAASSTAAVGTGRCVPDLGKGGQPPTTDKSSIRHLRRRRRTHDAGARAVAAASRANCSTFLHIAGSLCCRQTRRAGAETAADLFANIGSQPWLVELASQPAAAHGDVHRLRRGQAPAAGQARAIRACGRHSSVQPVSGSRRHRPGEA